MQFTLVLAALTAGLTHAAPVVERDLPLPSGANLQLVNGAAHTSGGILSTASSKKL
ncbi:hypothetical protein HK100_010237, partial [Physocladia obscura]